MDRHVRSLVADARETLGGSLPGTRRQVAEGLGVGLREDSRIGKLIGMYDYSGPTITINPTLWRDRVEFTFYHEITHHLLELDGSLISYLQDHVKDSPSHQRTIERACNVGAAEFLVPHASVRTLAEQSNWDADLIRCVHGSFGASWIASLLQIASIAPHSCIAVVFGLEEYSHCSEETIWGTNARLSISPVVLNSLSSNSMKYWLARGTLLPSDHPFFHSWMEGIDIDEHGYIPYKSGKRQPCRCVGLRRGGIVLGLLHAGTPVPIGQRRLFS